jgi:hypothetical protein
MFWIPFLLLSSALTASPQPLQLHPANPHYFLFRGKPTILVTSGEHYGAVLNLDFDFQPYLDELARCDFNLTRTFSGTYREVPGSFRIRDNTLAPRTDRFSSPWVQQDGKFDLDRFDEGYFRRLREFLTEASRRGIVVEYVLFCPLYDDNLWDVSPMNAKNIVNGVGRVPRTEVLTLKHPELVQRQLAFVRRAVTELNPFDNVYFEICNEPYFAGVALDWQRRVAREIVATESALPNKHLIAQNIANEKARVDDPTPCVSIFNFHYASPPVTVSMNRHLNKPIAFDETGFKGTGDRVYRRQAWEFMLAGGAVFSNLDYSFTPEHEDGTAKVGDPTPGGGGKTLRKQLGILKRFLEKLDLIEMTPDSTRVRLVAPQGHDRTQIWSLADRKHQVFAVYAPSGPTATLKLDGVEGSCRITWIDPRDGTMLESRDVAAGRRTALEVTSPPFEEDAVLLVTRQMPKP